MSPSASAERAERLLADALPPRAARKRMLIIVNPYATTVSDRLKNLVVYALQGRYDVEAIDTDAPGHATEICREAVEEDYDVVVAFGGDGTVNEVANGLRGSQTPLTCLPGGATNVFCRTLGIPGDVVDATEHLLRLADGYNPQRVDLGVVNGRAFVFASGIGLDASVVKTVDEHPRLKARLGEYYFTWAAIGTYNRHFLVNPPRLSVEAGGQVIEGVTAVVQNSDPFTYFGRRPICVCDGAALDNGTLALTVLKKAGVAQMPTLLGRVFSARAQVVQRHRQIHGDSGLREIRVTSTDGRALPVQVDGDYYGDYEEIKYSVEPLALTVVA